MSNEPLEGEPPRPPEPFSLTGRNALITGAARGIGYATAVRMIEAGANVALNDIDADALQDAVRTLPTGTRVIALPGDVADTTIHPTLVRRVVEELGSLDILVNNAGTFRPTPLDALDGELVDRQYAVNVKGVLFLASAAAAVMPAGSAIVNVSSLGGVRPPFAGLSAYHATKGAVDSLTRDMALEWGPRGIRVNGVGPGGILTGGRTQVTKDPLFPAEVINAITERATGRPAGRMGYADDVATVIVFMASPAARFVTGQLLLVDGGYFYT